LLFDRTALRQSTSEAASETRKPEKKTIETVKFVCAAAAFGNETLSGQQLFNQGPIYQSAGLA